MSDGDKNVRNFMDRLNNPKLNDGDPFVQYEGPDRRDTAGFEAMLERAATAGSKKALEGVGLHDENAVMDVRELRGVLDSWRTVKKTVLVTITRAATVGLLSLLAIGTWFYFGKK